MAERNKDIDAIKGLGILFVVLGHHWNVKPVIGWIYSFHMPLFFIISGYLYRHKPIRFSEYGRHKFQILMLPYFGYSILTVLWKLIQVVVYRMGIDIRTVIIYSVTTYGEGSLWFLPTLFWASLMFEAINRKEGASKPAAFLIVGMLGIGCAYTYQYVEVAKILKYILQYVGRVCLGTLFMYIGFYFREKHSELMTKKNQFLLFLGTGMVSLLSFGYSGLDMRFCRIGNPATMLIAALSGSLFVIFFWGGIAASREIQMADLFGKKLTGYNGIAYAFPN